MASIGMGGVWVGNDRLIQHLQTGGRVRMVECEPQAELFGGESRMVACYFAGTSITLTTTEVMHLSQRWPGRFYTDRRKDQQSMF